MSKSLRAALICCEALMLMGCTASPEASPAQARQIAPEVQATLAILVQATLTASATESKTETETETATATSTSTSTPSATDSETPTTISSSTPTKTPPPRPSSTFAPSKTATQPTPAEVGGWPARDPVARKTGIIYFNPPTGTRLNSDYCFHPDGTYLDETIEGKPDGKKNLYSHIEAPVSGNNLTVTGPDGLETLTPTRFLLIDWPTLGKLPDGRAFPNLISVGPVDFDLGDCVNFSIGGPTDITVAGIR